MIDIVPKLLAKRGIVMTNVVEDLATFVDALAFGIAVSLLLRRIKPLD